jgi:hypothetical protein
LKGLLRDEGLDKGLFSWSLSKGEFMKGHFDVKIYVFRPPFNGYQSSGPFGGNNLKKEQEK